MKAPLFDYAAVFGFVVLLVGLIVLAGIDRAAPAHLLDAFKITLGVVLRSGVSIANGHLNNRTAL